MSDTGLRIEVVVESPLWEGCEAFLARALDVAARAEGVRGLVNLLLTHDAALARLNHDWRGKAGPTNVLSFPAAPNAHAFIGDIALAAETVAAEARAQAKSLDHHAAHLVVHGFLHLLGYDHAEETEAAAMERREREILAELGVSDPHAEAPPANLERTALK